jgi:A/G-specific adenine glycosylase
MVNTSQTVRVARTARERHSANLTLSAPQRRRFARQVIAWQQEYGRHGLPWQNNRDPYAIWLSEVMLQQTQVSAVIPYYERFLERFPSCFALAAAPLDEVMRLWSGLGYYSRARNLHRAARIIVERYGGEFPRSCAAIAELPGVGRSTAAAIAAFAFGARHALLDGNVKRVLSRVFAIEGDGTQAARERSLWSLAERLLPANGIEGYSQGLMDLGATVCLRRGAKCTRCPLVGDCVAYRSGRVDELPMVRARKALPQRDTVMLLLQHNGAVLLEKRPPSGIWGALWSLPELAPQENPLTICRERFGVNSATLTELPSIDHGFTHFRLRIRPVRIDVSDLHRAVSEPGRMWVPLAEAFGAALPVPVRRILRSL